MNVGLCIWMTYNPRVVVKEDTAGMTLEGLGVGSSLPHCILSFEIKFINSFNIYLFSVYVHMYGLLLTRVEVRRQLA